MENILIIKHGALGDFVIAIGVMRALRERHPEARFTLMTMAPFVGIGEKMEMFSDYIVDNRVSWVRLKESIRVIKALVHGKFTHVYNLQPTTRTRTYRKLWRCFAPAGSECYWLNWGECACILRRGRLPLLPASEEMIPEDRLPRRVTDLRFLHGDGKHFDRLPQRYVLLIPGCSPQHAYKRWPVAHYREIVRRLAEMGVQAVLLGTQAEAEEANAICEGNPSVVNMVGLTSIPDVPQVALRALAVLGNDTGPSHMASFTGVFTIAMYDKRTACGALRGPHAVNLVSESTIDLITPDEVWQHLLPHLTPGT